MNFYAVIIGTEILDARREDKHFSFLRDELKKHGHELFASFILKDDQELIQHIFNLVKSDKKSIMFCFGGIGTTPDDLTRFIAAKVFTSSSLIRHEKFEKDIVDKFKKEAYPHRIHMSDLPKGAKLIFNPINNMSGFCLQNRFFFVPGFPNMAHPMIVDILNKNIPISTKKYRLTFIAKTSENNLISIMEEIPKHIELSSLPILNDTQKSVELSLSSTNIDELNRYFKLFIDSLDTSKISYILI